MREAYKCFLVLNKPLQVSCIDLGVVPVLQPGTGRVPGAPQPPL